MEVRLVWMLCFFALVAAVNARRVKSKPGTLEDTYGDFVEDGDESVQNDEYDLYGEDTEVQEENADVKNDVTSEFRSKPEVFVAHVGDVVRLPCVVTNPEDVVLMWRKDENELLYQGDIAGPIRFPNIRRTNESLEINITSENDFGKYTCQMMVSQTNNPQITHSVVMESPPKIVAVQAADNKTVYKVGDPLQLTCLATGYPKPKISWHRGSEMLGVKGETLVIPNLKPKNAGIYRCFADNNNKSPAHAYIEIFVEHKPTVSIEKYLVNSDHGSGAELKCTVHAYPAAAVVWKKDGMNIKADPPKVILKRNQDNVENELIIRNLTDADFGEYTCSAQNHLDRVEKNVSLVKTPAVQEFVKPEKMSRDMVLTWKVESKAPISEHQLQYRKRGEEEWKDLNPEVTRDEDDVYTVKHTLKGLEPGSYETRTRSKNSHGWSPFSETVFEGVLPKNGPHHKHSKKHKEKDMKEKQSTSATQPTPAQHQENQPPSTGASEVAGGCPSIKSSIYLTSIALLALCFRQ